MTIRNEVIATPQSARSGPIQVIAGVVVPATSPVLHAIEFAREHCEPYLFNHVMRSWLFAVLAAQQKGTAHDEQVLAIATLLHDVGLESAFDGSLRFEVEGANAARTFALAQGMAAPQAQLIWDGVALNSTPSIGLYKEPEVALCTVGIGMDWGGWGYESLTAEQAGTIVDAFPRLGMKQKFAHAVCRIVESRPQTTYDNFARDFGERFVAGYRRPSTVDLLMQAPFNE